MTNPRLTTSALLLVLSLAPAVSASLNITSINSPVTIDFQATQSEVNFGAFGGTGFGAGTTTTGQLDSNTWRASDSNSGTSVAFGGSAGSGVFGRGATAAAASTSSPGIWSFDTGSGNLALGVRSHNGTAGGATGFDPGSIVLRVQNNTGSTVNAWTLGYDLFQFNDGNRSTTITFEYSTNDSSYSASSITPYTTPGNATGAAWSAAIPNSTAIPATVSNGQFLYLRWTFDAATMGGGQDQVALDNISVAAVPEPSAFLFGGLVCGVMGLAAGGKKLAGKLRKRNAA